MIEQKRISREVSDFRDGSRITRLNGKRGAASALIILLIVLLIFFGMLAMVTAHADLRLAQRRADWTQSYFIADQQAETIIAELDYILLNADSPGRAQTSAFQAVSRLFELNDAAEVISLYEIDDVIFAEVLVYNPERALQGIQFSVAMRPGQTDATLRMSTISWLQWQPPAEPAERPGLWDGE